MHAEQCTPTGAGHLEQSLWSRYFSTS